MVSRILAEGVVLPISFLDIVTCSIPICDANSDWVNPNIALIAFKSSGKLYFISSHPPPKLAYIILLKQV